MVITVIVSHTIFSACAHGLCRILAVAATGLDAYNAWTIDDDIQIYLAALVAWYVVTLNRAPW